MGDKASTTTPVWTINPKDKQDWVKTHNTDTPLVKKFRKSRNVFGRVTTYPHSPLLESK